jgi:hypothetical protein
MPERHTPRGLRIVTVTAEYEDGAQIEECERERDTETSAGVPGEAVVTKLDITREVVHRLPVAGVPKWEIACRLNERGAPSPTGKTRGSVRQQM